MNDSITKIDITDVVCPTTFVKVKAVLDGLEPGGTAEIRLNDGEPIQNIPRSLKNEGHRVTKVEKIDDATWLLSVAIGGRES